MMENLMTALLFAVVYTVTGLVFNELTYKYLKELEEKTRKVDARFVNELYVHIRAKGKLQEKFIGVCWLTFWPITVITAVLKAESAFSRVKNHVNYRAR